ncbi:MAG: hypothetical protein JWQ03_743 [Variovorax sp.]|nr:hypothetical protein [Variovorax sp.]
MDVLLAVRMGVGGRFSLSFTLPMGCGSRCFPLLVPVVHVGPGRLCIVVRVAVHLAAMRMSAALRHQLVIVGLVELRQFLQKSSQVPDGLVVHALAPCRHAGGLDAVLDGPESLPGAYFLPGQIGRLGIEPVAEFAALYARVRWHPAHMAL